MKISVQLFAVAKQLANRATVEVQLSPEATVAELRTALPAGWKPASLGSPPLQAHDPVTDDPGTVPAGALGDRLARGRGALAGVVPGAVHLRARRDRREPAGRPRFLSHLSGEPRPNVAA